MTGRLLLYSAPHCSAFRRFLGQFRRAWIASVITEENWRTHGMLRWVQGRMVYVAVVRARTGGSYVDRYAVQVSVPGGRLIGDLCAEFATLDTALADVRAGSNTVIGRAAIVERLDYPPDSGGGWLMISRGPPS